MSRPEAHDAAQGVHGHAEPRLLFYPRLSPIFPRMRASIGAHVVLWLVRGCALLMMLLQTSRAIRFSSPKSSWKPFNHSDAPISLSH